MKKKKKNNFLADISKQDLNPVMGGSSNCETALFIIRSGIASNKLYGGVCVCFKKKYIYMYTGIFYCFFFLENVSTRYSSYSKG